MFPRWLNQHLSGDGRQQLEQARYGENGFDFERPSVGLDFRVNSVCATCNNGWMSDLEGTSRPYLEPLITGLASQWISVEAQYQIALWATKTAMMVDQTQAKPLIPDAALANFGENLAIPPYTHIWLGACESKTPLVTTLTVRIELEQIDAPAKPWPISFYCPMKVGHLCLYLYFPPIPVFMRHPSMFHLFLGRIWPARTDDLGWSPPVRLSDGPRFEEFADLFWRELQMSTPEQARAQGFDVA
jgi:hypothetical protein